jgi:hypothetical protein
MVSAELKIKACLPRTTHSQNRYLQAEKKCFEPKL